MNDDLPPSEYAAFQSWWHSMESAPYYDGIQENCAWNAWQARAALAVRGEPVAWRLPNGASFISSAAKKQNPITFVEYTEPLYTAPQAPLTLTDERILQLWSGDTTPTPRPVLGKKKVIDFARAVLAAAQERK